jgi:hypothetical protein
MRWLACSRFCHLGNDVKLVLPGNYPDTIVPVIKLNKEGARNFTMMHQKWSPFELLP